MSELLSEYERRMRKASQGDAAGAGDAQVQNAAPSGGDQPAGATGQTSGGGTVKKGEKGAFFPA